MILKSLKIYFIKHFPIIFIIIIWLIFSFPYFMLGKVPFPSTYLANNFSPWNTYEVYRGPVKNAATPDVITQIYPWKKLTIDIWKSGNIPLWNPYSFSGTPLMANYQSGVFSPMNSLFFILPFIDAWSIQVLLAPLLAGLFMYLYSKQLKMSNYGSLLSSIAFMFCGFITCWMVYGTLPYAIAFLPLALFAIEKYLQGRNKQFLILFAVTIPLSFFSGHFQTSLYFFTFLFSYLVFKTIISKDTKLILLLASTLIIGLLLSAPQILPSIEFYLNSVRSEIFMKTEVIPWSYLPAFLSPDLFGNPVTRNDWFGHYAEWNSYIGVIPFFLALYSLSRRNKYAIFYSLVSIIVILLAFQTPLLDLLISLKIPVLSTSAASRVIVLFSFSFAVLAGMGTDRLMKDLDSRNNRRVNYLLAGIILSIGLIWMAVIMRIAIPADKVAIAVSNLRLPTLIASAFLSLVVFYKFIHKKNYLKILFVMVVVITAIDMIRFAAKWQPFESRGLVFPATPVDEFLVKKSGYSRAFGSYGQEFAMNVRIPAIEGYDPLYIGRYGEFAGAAQDGKFHKSERSVVSLSKNGLYTGKILDFLGVKYIIHKVSDGKNVWAFPFWDYPVDQFRSVYKDDKYEIFENDKALDRAFLVADTYSVNEPKQILKSIFREELDLRSGAVVEDLESVKAAEHNGKVSITKYMPNKIELTTQAEKNAVLVLSDPFYPGWKVFIDNAEARIYRANYAFRAVPIPAGKHSVTFTYDPDSFKIGLMLFIFGAVSLLLIAFYPWKSKSQR